MDDLELYGKLEKVRASPAYFKSLWEGEERDMGTIYYTLEGKEFMMDYDVKCAENINHSNLKALIVISINHCNILRTYTILRGKGIVTAHILPLSSFECKIYAASKLSHLIF
jgi:hypothetical protein